MEQVRVELAEAPHYSTVRALLRVLEEKGHILHVEQNVRYVYRPVVPKPKAATRYQPSSLQTSLLNHHVLPHN